MVCCNIFVKDVTKIYDNHINVHEIYCEILTHTFVPAFSGTPCIYRVLTSKNVKSETAPEFTKQFQMSLSTKFDINFGISMTGKDPFVRLCQFCSHRVTF